MEMNDREKYSALADLTNNAFVQVDEFLRGASIMNYPFSPSSEVYLGRLETTWRKDLSVTGRIISNPELFGFYQFLRIHKNIIGSNEFQRELVQMIISLKDFNQGSLMGARRLSDSLSNLSSVYGVLAKLA